MRKRTLKSIIIALLMLILFQVQGFCSFHERILADTRTLALGNSYAADPYSNFAFNPSVLGLRGKIEFGHTFSSTPILDLSSSFSTLQVGSLGITYSKLVMEDVAMEKYSTQAIGASFGASFSGFNVGATLRRYQMTLGSNYKDALTTMDLSLQKSLSKMINTGIVFENIFGLQAENTNAPPLKPTVRFGFNFNFFDTISLNLDLDTTKNTYLGLESILYQGVKIRAGLDDDTWSLGCGFTNGRLSSDYVYLWGGMSNEHIVTLKISL